MFVAVEEVLRPKKVNRLPPETKPYLGSGALPINKTPPNFLAHLSSKVVAEVAETRDSEPKTNLEKVWLAKACRVKGKSAGAQGSASEPGCEATSCDKSTFKVLFGVVACVCGDRGGPTTKKVNRLPPETKPYLGSGALPINKTLPIFFGAPFLESGRRSR